MLLTEMIRDLEAFRELCGNQKNCPTIELRSLVGSCFGAVAAAAAAELGGIHIVVMGDRDKAAYACNDLYALAGEQNVLFFPAAYKRSIQFGQEDPSGIVQRTAALQAIRNFTPGPGRCLILCTYPEAVVEKVVDKDRLGQSTLTIRTGESLSMDFVVQLLREGGFERVDFVYEPGQYSVRGGIIDLFSYSANQPYRLDFFGDEVESIRSFKVGTQLSDERMGSIEVVPNLKRLENALQRMSLAGFAGAGTTWWMEDLEHTLGRLNAIRSKVLGDLDEPARIDRMVTGRKAFLEETAHSRMLLLADRARERTAQCSFDFGCAPQPSFNKKFELLAGDLIANREKGYRTYILSENRAQTERP